MIFIILVLTACIYGAYTMCFQDTTLLVSKKISPLTEETFLGSPIAKNIQNAITPKCQNLNNIICFSLFFCSAVLTVFLFKWYYVIFTVIGILSAITPMKRLFPKVGSKHYLQIIRKDMIQRLDLYHRKKDLLREELLSSLMRDFDRIVGQDLS